jgi:hypothetical protein
MGLVLACWPRSFNTPVGTVFLPGDEHHMLALTRSTVELEALTDTADRARAHWHRTCSFPSSATYGRLHEQRLSRIICFALSVACRRRRTGSQPKHTNTPIPRPDPAPIMRGPASTVCAAACGRRNMATDMLIVLGIMTLTGLRLHSCCVVVGAASARE